MKKQQVSDHRDICDYLDWDSSFFGFPVGKVIGDTLSTPRALAIDAWCKENNIRCLYFLASSNHPETITIAEKYGYHFVDIRMTLAYQVSENLQCNVLIPNGVVVRPAVPEDLLILQEIAMQSYSASRYYFDPNFPKDRCDALYAIWIEKSVQEHADWVFVIAKDDSPMGYIVCRLEPLSARGYISLFGISHHHRGQGLGGILILTALEWFRAQEVGEVLVVTQGRNIVAQRLYQRSGFKTRDVQLWYHKWF